MRHTAGNNSLHGKAGDDTLHGGTGNHPPACRPGCGHDRLGLQGGSKGAITLAGGKAACTSLAAFSKKISFTFAPASIVA
ncbi:MAG: hypothetical protein GDA53_05315 [Rhodobacteraceae bacterium]|nr:hypothetical protein [Paracoccaceae bacterium]